MKKNALLAVMMVAGSMTLSAQSVVINELQAANVDMFVDPSFNYGSWIELYNPTDKDISLNGWYISDTKSELKKYSLGKKRGTIKAKGYKVLWLDNHSKYAPTQINTKLDYDGGSIYISDNQGKLVCQMDYPEAISRTSYARTTDGGNEWGVTAQPTPGKSNASSTFATERLEAPVVNRDGGLYPSKVTVRVTIPEGAKLRYTTNGTTPTETNGTLSTTGVISVSSTKTMRFRLFKDGYLPSRVVTRSYIITDRKYNLPVISVVTNPDNLYSDSLGILVKGVNGRTGNGQSTPCNWNMDWERPVNFEYFTTDGEMVINQEANMERCGGWSRAWTPHSFKIKANKVFEGENYIPYQIFPKKTYLKHRTLQIRNGGNDNNCRIKDAALQTIVHTSGLNIDGQECQPVVHYINGSFKGLLNIREPNNKHFVEANYGLDDEEIDQFEMSPDSNYVQKCGTDESFLRWYELSANASDNATYEEICNMVDIDEYINYMAVELYLGSDDWPQNNVKAFKPRYEGGKFRFVLFDLDHSFNLSSNAFSTFANKKTHTFAHVYETNSSITAEIKLVTIFLNMLKNNQFRKQFIDSFCLMAGSVFVPERCNAIIDSMATNIEQVLSYENKSPWGTANELKSNLSNRQRTMISGLKSYGNMKLSGVKEQTVSFKSNLPQARLLLNGMPVPTNQFEGTLFTPITLKAEAPAGYRFAGWKNSASTQIEIFGKSSTWHYYDQGSQDGIDWKTSLMTAWPTGKAPLGYYTGDTNNSRGHNTTLNYGDANNKRPTYYFSKEFTLENTPESSDIYTLDFGADDGIVVYVNGIEAGRYLMNSGNVSYNTFSSTYAQGNPDFSTMTLPANLFKKGKNVIAVEVHNNNSTSTDIYFDAALLASVTSYGENTVCEDEEYTLPAGQSLSLVACYEAIPEDELPTSDNVPVRINEVSADNSIYVAPTYFKKNDWIELYNTTNQAIDIAGMFLTDKIDKPEKFQIPSSETINTVIPPHGYLIIWADKLEPEKQLHASFKLDNEGGHVMLTAADKTWSDTLYYPAHAGNESVGLYPDGGNNTYLMNIPTIAATNRLSSYAQHFIQSELPSSIEYAENTSGKALYANYKDGLLNIHGREDSQVTLTLFTASGNTLMQANIALQNGQATFSVGELNTGLYIVHLQDNSGNLCNQKLMVVK